MEVVALQRVGFLPAYHHTLGRIVRWFISPRESKNNGSVNPQPFRIATPPITFSKDKFSPVKSLRESVEDFADKPLLILNGKKIPGCDIYLNAIKVAEFLKKHGIKEGSKVALMGLPHERELFESFFAIQLLGAIPVLINFKQPAETILSMFKTSGADALLVGRHLLLQKGAKKLALGGFLKNVIVFNDVENPNPSHLFKSYSSVIERFEGLDDSALFLDPKNNTPALMLFTSGTSGNPKTITYTYEIVSSITKSLERFNISEKDTVLLPVPFYHVAGLLIFLGALKHRCPLVLSEIPRKSSPETIEKTLRSIEENKVTIFPGVPAIIKPVLEEAVKQGKTLDSLRLIFSGGAEITKDLVSQVEEINKMRARKSLSPIKIVNFYASTECGPISSSYVNMNNLNSVGIPFPGVEVKLPENKDDGLLVKVDEFPPDLQANALTTDSRFKTGDEIEIRNGELILLGRLSDRLNIGAEKVSPTSIENEISKYQGIKEVYVFGIPENGTDIVCALIIPSNDKSTVDLKDLHRFLKENNLLPLSQHPKHLFVEKDIPFDVIGSTGKVTRKLLQKKYRDRVITPTVKQPEQKVAA